MLHLLHKHLLACIACLVCFGLGIASTALYNHFQSTRDVIFRNAVDNELQSKLQGSWFADDLRTPEIETSSMEFKSSGELVDQDNDFLKIKWTCMNGLIYISSKRIDGIQPNWKGLPDPFMPTFGENSDELTFGFAGREPHLKLIRKRT